VPLKPLRFQCANSQSHDATSRHKNRVRKHPDNAHDNTLTHRPQVTRANTATRASPHAAIQVPLKPLRFQCANSQSHDAPSRNKNRVRKHPDQAHVNAQTHQPQVGGANGATYASPGHAPWETSHVLSHPLFLFKPGRRLRPFSEHVSLNARH